jgi:hypothetical protein
MFNLSRSVTMNRHVAVLVGVLMLVLSGASLASAQELLQPDGRINQVTHFGGDSFYCVDTNLVSTNSYPVALNEGGFRLLNSVGQELWFIPAADLQAAIDESIATGKGVLVAQGQGTYGVATLFTYREGETQKFVFSGYDEFGKPNSLTYDLCTPVGPTIQIPSIQDEELCTLVEYDLNKVSHFKTYTPVFEPIPTTTRQVPCDTCPEYSSKLVGKLNDRILVQFYDYCVEDGNPNL